MPLPLIVALLLAFAHDAMDSGTTRIASFPAIDRAWDVLLAMAVPGVVAVALGYWMSRRSSSTRRTHLMGRPLLGRLARVTEAMNLAAYGFVLYGLDWPGFVRDSGISQSGPAHLLAMLAPFACGQMAIWTGLHLADRRLSLAAGQAAAPATRLGRFLMRRLRPSYGLLLPLALAFLAGGQFVEWACPQALDWPLAPLLGMAAMGLCMLTVSPLLIRLAWPTRSLPEGPLRQRLEALARELGFRYTDIRVWDTDHRVVNAGVTGAWPWFRYVLLTDALIERLDPRQIDAVFGHEVGHVAHRHFPYLGFFAVSSLGVLGLISQVLDTLVNRVTATGWLVVEWSGQTGLVEAVSVILAVCALGLYFYVVFGFLSRRFERQADLYGCRVVSGQGMALDGMTPRPATSVLVPSPTVSSEGVAVFASTLARVAMANGMATTSRSWRHGSIARRIRFLENLAEHPDSQHHFQERVSLLKWGLATCLVAVMAVALATGALV